VTVCTRPEEYFRTIQEVLLKSNFSDNEGDFQPILDCLFLTSNPISPRAGTSEIVVEENLVRLVREGPVGRSFVNSPMVEARSELVLEGGKLKSLSVSFSESSEVELEAPLEEWVYLDLAQDIGDIWSPDYGIDTGVYYTLQLQSKNAAKVVRGIGEIINLESGGSAFSRLVVDEDETILGAIRGLNRLAPELNFYGRFGNYVITSLKAVESCKISKSRNQTLIWEWALLGSHKTNENLEDNCDGRDWSTTMQGEREVYTWIPLKGGHTGVWGVDSWQLVFSGESLSTVVAFWD